LTLKRGAREKVTTIEKEKLKNGNRIFEIQADLIAMFANPRRIMIINILGEEEMSVGAIAEALDLPIPNVSQHLRVMKDRNVVASRKEGQTVYYRMTNPKFGQCCKIIRTAIIEELAKNGELLEEHE
jgi:ArsR family transcriptional regulator, virulence genes transcriptional regulator